MLIGPPWGRLTPRLPDESEGMEGIYRYLRDLNHELLHISTSIVVNTFGLIGMRGISGTSTQANNFSRGVLSVGGGTTAAWVFTNPEIDATYMVFIQNSTESNMISAIDKSVSRLLLTFSPTAIAGSTVDIVLVR